MTCPKCNKEMEIQWTEKLKDGTTEAVGRCWDCDYDGRWIIATLPSGETVEYDLKQFYFG